MGVPVGVKLILDDTNANIPANWSEDTNYAGRYALGAADSANGGTNSGQATHTHNLSSHTHTFSGGAGSGSTLVSLTIKSKIFAAQVPHTHASATSNASTTTSGTASNDPPYYEVIFITPTSTPQDIPAGVVGLFDDTLPTGWTNYTTLNDKWLKGVASGGDAGGTGGSLDSHTHTTAHTHSAKNSAPAVLRYAVLASSGFDRTTQVQQHTHSVSLTSATAPINSADGIPPYRDLIPATSASIDTPIGVIGLWDSTVALIPSGWERVTAQDDKFLRADSAVGTGGSDTHTHTNNGTHNHGSSAGLPANQQTDRTFAGLNVAAYGNSHTWTIGTSSPTLSANTTKTNYPLYRTTIFIKYIGAVVSAFKPYIQSY